MIIATEKDIEIARMLWDGSVEAAQDVPGKIDGTIEAIGWMSLQVARIRSEAVEEARKEAADIAVEWVNKNLCDEHMPIMFKRMEEDELRAAILKEATE